MEGGSPRLPVLRSYGAEIIRRLQETATEYDPDGVFQKLQNGDCLRICYAMFR